MQFLDQFFLFGAKIMKKMTSLVIQNEDDFEKNISEKTMIIFGHPLCELCKKVMFRIPLYIIKAKKKGYKLKFCNVKELKNLAYDHDIKVTPTLIIFEKGEEKRRYQEKEIFNFFNG